MSRAAVKMTPTVAEHAVAALPGVAEATGRKSAWSACRLVSALVPLRVVLFLTLFAWILYAWVDLRLVFQWRESLFLWNFRFLSKFLARPGALMEWTDRLLVQLCYWGWPGVLVVTAAAWLLLVATISLMNACRMGFNPPLEGGLRPTLQVHAARRPRLGSTWVVPAILLVAMCGQYQFRASTVVGLALAVTAANGWARLPVRRPSLRLILFLVVSAWLYYVAGPAYYSFAACCTIHEVLAARRRVLGVCCLLAAVGVKFGLDAVFSHIGLVIYYCEAPPVTGYDVRLLNGAVVLLYAYFPACAATVLITLRRDGFPSRRSVMSTKPSRRSVMSTIMRWIAGTALLLATAAVAGFYAVDRELKISLEIDYFAEHRLWTDVIAKAGNLPARLYSPCVNHDVNLALYHLGRLPYDMFAYPQRYLPLLAYQSVPRAALMRKPFDLLLELGRVNEAEHVALEMLEVSPCGGTLKRLALVKLIKGQTAAAGVVLQVLRDDIVWGRWAEAYLHRVAADPTLVRDDEIQQIRRLMVVEDDRPMIDKPGPGGVSTVLPALLESIAGAKQWKPDGRGVPPGDGPPVARRPRGGRGALPFGQRRLARLPTALRGSSADPWNRAPQRSRGDRRWNLLPREKDQRAGGEQISPLSADPAPLRENRRGVGSGRGR